MNAKPYTEARKLVKLPWRASLPRSGEHAVAHHASGVLEGIRAYKEAREGIKDYDPNKMARARKCGRLLRAVPRRYYFKGRKSACVSLDQGFARMKSGYYDEIGFKDWTHAESGAPVLKAPSGIRDVEPGNARRRGGACADCHMPYMRVGP
jgi:nitrite reductase (cytochrome c-552)